MEKALIIYGSSTGNTEKIAQVLAQELKTRFDVTLLDVTDAEPRDMTTNDVLLLGSSTWYDGQLQEDFQEFYDSMDEVDLKGKRVAVFGTGDSSWDEFCAAVDILEEKVLELNAEIMAPGFKWDGEVTEEALPDIRTWASKLH
ncbi:MAG TPA: flavodoxin [Syntrophomonadaceae bacterium]|nr:flavodoxin [Syntrophomonadaceae bacterium]